MNKKKQREFDFLIEFKKASGYNFNILEYDRESPDFIIENKNQKIGVEIREVFIDEIIQQKGGSHLKLEEAEQERIINSAREAYQEKALPPIIVKVKFISGIKFSKNINEKITKTLFQSLSKVELVNWENTNIIDRDFPNDLSQYFSLVYVQRSPNQNNSWQPILFGFVYDLSEEKIRDIIRAKEKKIHRYQKSANINWLIIPSDGRYPSSMIDISTKKLNFKIDSLFDKIFFLTYPKVKTFVLK